MATVVSGLPSNQKNYRKAALQQILKMKTIAIDGFLVQAKLEGALQSVIEPSDWIGREVRVGETRYKWDIAYKRGGQLVFVEFDGEDHYRSALRIKVDQIKDVIAKGQGAQIVRFPYWVQLTTETAKHFFGLDVNVVQSYRHGFIDKKACLPASFCELGVDRFAKELGSLPASVRAHVEASLLKKVEEHGRQFVLPKYLSGLGCVF